MDLTALVVALIGVLTAVAARYAIPFLKEKWGEAKLNNVIKWVKIAVGAAEMIYKESGMGPQKKAYVLEFLNRKGFTVDLDTLDNIIENAVLELNAEK
ncbi:MAG: holin [Clostridia bacterium]|nr:holin [Clostridia bacterium]